MFSEKIKDLKNKRKLYKKEKLEKKKRAERRKKREAKKKQDEKKALEKKKMLQARRDAFEKEKNAKIKTKKIEELTNENKKETKKYLKERRKKHEEYLKIKKKMEKTLLKKENDQKKSKISFLGIIFLIICIIGLSYSSYQIFIWIKSTKDLETIEEKIITKVVKEVEDKSKDYSIDVNFEELEKINSDVVGWIYIKNTDVNYPILQAKDNDYYLKKNIYKEYSSCGSIFLDCNTDGFSEDNTVVYGHNLKNQKMFADLKKIYDGEFGKDVYIEVFDENNTFIKYKIFATYMVEPTLEVIKKDFKISEKKKYIDYAYNESTVKFNCGFNYQKDLLTLITCDNTGDKRIIVNALRVN